MLRRLEKVQSFDQGGYQFVAETRCSFIFLDWVWDEQTVVMPHSKSKAHISVAPFLSSPNPTFSLTYGAVCPWFVLVLLVFFSSPNPTFSLVYGVVCPWFILVLFVFGSGLGIGPVLLVSCSLLFCQVFLNFSLRRWLQQMLSYDASLEALHGLLTTEACRRLSAPMAKSWNPR